MRLQIPTSMSGHRILGRTLLLGALLSSSAAYGTERGEASPLSTGSLKISYEEFTLPGNEKMGMTSLGISHDFTKNFHAGVGSWMAVKGERGGFITLGIDGGLFFPLTERIGVDTGLFIGGGGGRGGYTLSGGGLMLRSHAALTYDLGSWGRLGAGVSHVDFPDGGTITSTQPFVSYTLPFYSFVEKSRNNTGNRTLKSDQYLQLSPKRHALAVMKRDLHIASTTLTDTGTPQGNLSLLGIEWRTYLDDTWFARLETEGAAGGNSAGYMQILAGGGYRVPLGGNLYASSDLSLGGGGGGGIDSGGGLLFNASADMQYFLTRNLFADISAGYLKSNTGTFEAKTLAFKIGYQTGNRSRQKTEAADNHIFVPACMQIRAVSQTYFKAADNWRSHHADQNVDNLGVQIDYFLDRDWYLTGQGLAAYGGGAGAYMTGLVGTGSRKTVAGNLFLNAEGLVGAAGGGGLAIGSGLVWQGNLGVGYDISPALSAMMSAGRMQAMNGDFKANVIGLSLGYNFKSYMSETD
ncbi:hypothetical protein [Chlorobium ferrooxidans]|uniref:Uncharacterized protein n=1 Tax=Chlorobium ferrooxidans DSM 13031 TaxID=377431 RepID=Q0YTQ7_9CHLB|nr:hypothetical protein [Chlorobium ferrooxidans]EAT59843.1 conserved hypothetical protein [Chlorobium ferrooxidans DSM 13031]